MARFKHSKVHGAVGVRTHTSGQRPGDAGVNYRPRGNMPAMLGRGARRDHAQMGGKPMVYGNYKGAAFNNTNTSQFGQESKMSNGRANCGPTFYNLPGNAGLPGCGTGTLEGTECHYQQLARVLRDVPAFDAASPDAFQTLQISALRAGAFKPRFVYMFGVGATAETSELNTRFEVVNVNVQGLPQLIATQGNAALGAPAGDYAILSDAYNRPDQPVAVPWAVFGSDAGQQLEIAFRPLADIVQNIHVIIWGDAADSSLIGQGGYMG